MGQSIGSLFPLQFRLWQGRKLFRRLESCAQRVSLHRVIKGPCGPQEVEAMRFVAKHTAIPVPKVYATHTWNGYIYIEMKYVRGESLEDAWIEGRLTPEQKEGVFANIKQYISSLRMFKPPAEDLVASSLQNPIYDSRISARLFGPLSHNDFHSLTRGHVRIKDVA